MSVTIVGAGLAGLATAYRLNQAGVNVQVLEANSYAGGRIQPARGFGHQDFGPTWVWPYAQPIVTHWLKELGLELFDQFDTGFGLLDHYPDASAQKHNLPSQYGSARIKGGTHALIVALLDKLDGIVQFEHVVNNCIFEKQRWQLDVSTASAKRESHQITTDQLVVAIPPRLATNLLSLNDAELIDNMAQSIQILDGTPTWMAPHAKVVVIYETAFWREQNLSGRVASQVGPLVEIHDHSGPDGLPAALFGFAGIPAQSRLNNHEQLVKAIEQQLKRCFGENAPAPLNILIKDWAFAPYTTTAADRDGEGAHPQVLPMVVRRPHCKNSLWFAVSETSERSPGLIEGALARADDVAIAITSVSQKQ